MVLGELGEPQLSVRAGGSGVWGAQPRSQPCSRRSRAERGGIRELLWVRGSPRGGGHLGCV